MDDHQNRHPVESYPPRPHPQRKPKSSHSHVFSPLHHVTLGAPGAVMRGGPTRCRIWQKGPRSRLVARTCIAAHRGNYSGRTWRDLQRLEACSKAAQVSRGSRKREQVDRIWPKWAQLRPSVDRSWATICAAFDPRIRPNVRTTSTNVDPKSAKFGPTCLSDGGQHIAGLGPTLLNRRFGTRRPSLELLLTRGRPCCLAKRDGADSGSPRAPKPV